uniref:Ubiquitin-like domain-containing protein n=1 Tax=Coccolithus braarudii TaxID=221442 RepID=A0A7S0Q7J6_9EUKA
MIAGLEGQLRNRGYAQTTVTSPSMYGVAQRAWMVMGHAAKQMDKVNVVNDTTGQVNIISGVKKYVHLTGTATVTGLFQQFYSTLEGLAKSAALACGFDIPLAESAKLQVYEYFGEAGSAVAAWGCPEHIDSGVVTVILSSAPGLQVFDQLAEDWVDAQVEPAGTDQDWMSNHKLLTATVLVGHTLDVMSGGTYKAALHRVRQTKRTSVVLKLHAAGAAFVPAAGCTVHDLLEIFRRERASVNPQPGDSVRLSAVAGTPVAVENRSMRAVTCPEYLITFKEDFVSRAPLSLWIRGPVHPVLLSPYFLLWILQSWAARLSFTLPPELGVRILDLIPTDWHATTVAEVIQQLSAHQSVDGEHGSVMLFLGGRLIGNEAGARPLIQLAPERFTSTCVQGLSFVRVGAEVAGVQGSPRLNLMVYDQDGGLFTFKIRRRCRLVHLMYAWSTRSGISVNAVRFWFDSRTVRRNQTPEDLDMIDGDAMDVLIEQMGD